LKLTRRGLVAGAAATVVGGGGNAFAQRPAAVEAPVAIPVRATPIASLSTAEPERRRFGALTFRSGLDLGAELAGFGGFSGLARPDGRRLVAVTDNTQWLTATLESRDGRLVGLSGAVMAPLLAPDGRLLRRTPYYDTEGLAVAGSTAFVSAERRHALLRFDFGRHGVRARGQLVALPPEARTLPGNSGIEALGVAPPRSPLAGALVGVAERARDGDAAPTRGFVLTGPRPGAFQVARSEDFDVTDLAFLPSGDLLILERHFSLLRGVSARIRRIAAAAIRPGALVDGPVIYASEPAHRIDNMEGLCVHREGGETVVTMISDDNFSALQRTLLLEFGLAE
jgi:hypothetical protein